MNLRNIKSALCALSAIALMTLSHNLEAATPEPETAIVAKFGGWSHHFDDSPVGDWTENHLGYGVEYEYENVYGGIFQMKDSFGEPMTQLGVGYKFKPIKYIDLNLVVTYTSRSKAIYNVHVDEYQLRRSQFFMIMPYVTVNFTEHAHLDIIYGPKSQNGVSSVVFARFGYKF